MPRAEVGTPKWLANKMKSKGLQRLRWYCQMCEKQCRDENGFKCHRMSEGHLRQMQVFSQRAGRYMDEFSRKFEAAFMSLMRTRYCSTRVLANTVYCDLIADKQHVHMNATIWSTLSEFVLYLKRSGKCNVEHSDQGWFIEYIDTNKIYLEEREAEKRREEVSCAQMREKILNKQVAAAWKEKEDKGVDERESEQIVPFKRREGDEPLAFKIPVVAPVTAAESEASALPKFDFKKVAKPAPTLTDIAVGGSQADKKLTALERLRQEQERKKIKGTPLEETAGRKSGRSISPETERWRPSRPSDDYMKNGRRRDSESRASPIRTYHDDSHYDDRKKRRLRSMSRSSSRESSRKVSSRMKRGEQVELPTKAPELVEEEEEEEKPWLVPHLIVRIITESLADGKYHRQKGLIKAVKDKFVGEVEVIGRKDVLLIDQQMLEPVVPAKEGSVLVIRGPHTGKLAHVASVDIAEKIAEIDIRNEGTMFVDLGDICKYQVPAGETPALLS